MTACSGSGFSGYMGPCLAWPTGSYVAEEVSAQKLAETADWQRPKGPRRSWTAEKPPFVPRDEALKRHNCVVMARLRDRKTGDSFCVATYHMPCLFGTDEKCQVMIIHAAWLAQHAQRWARGTPLIVAGDFNIKPGDAAYNLLTSGSIHAANPQYPHDAPESASDIEQAWTPTSLPMRSAYVVATGSEPEFTNYAWTQFSKEQFCATLDYIWLSPEWRVNAVTPLPTRASLEAAAIESFPSVEEPSDHMMIGAALTL